MEMERRFFKWAIMQDYYPTLQYKNKLIAVCVKTKCYCLENFTNICDRYKIDSNDVLFYSIPFDSWVSYKETNKHHILVDNSWYLSLFAIPDYPVKLHSGNYMYKKYAKPIYDSLSESNHNIGFGLFSKTFHYLDDQTVPVIAKLIEHCFSYKINKDYHYYTVDYESSLEYYG